MRLTIYRTTVFTLGMLTFLYVPAILMALPYTPSSDDIVLERLPYSLTTSVAKKQQNSSKLKTLDEALEEAEELLMTARESADPRLYGRIQAILKPWWAKADPPLAVLKIRADILQKRHQFSEALSDVDKILTKDPRDVSTLYMQASIFRVLGKYPEAIQSCTAMQGSTHPFTVSLCTMSVLYLNGKLDESYQKLMRELQTPKGITPSLVAYGYGLLGEIAYAAGHYSDSERFLKLALQLGGKDPYILSLLADLYLETDRFDDVEHLLKEETENDTLLLRLALAKEASRSSKNPYADTFKLRLEEAARRGSRVHLREEAWYALDISDDAPRALSLAQENWETQKEPLDSRLVLRAALESKKYKAAAAVISFLKEADTEEIHLKKLMQALEQNQ